MTAPVASKRFSYHLSGNYEPNGHVGNTQFLGDHSLLSRRYNYRSNEKASFHTSTAQTLKSRELHGISHSSNKSPCTGEQLKPFELLGGSAVASRLQSMLVTNTRSSNGTRCFMRRRRTKRFFSPRNRRLLRVWPSVAQVFRAAFPSRKNAFGKMSAAADSKKDEGTGLVSSDGIHS